jgi:predicted Fe-Mo cluster-binding NifX family protein
MTLSDHFGEAPYFSLIRLRNPGNVVEEEKTLANPYVKEEKAKGIKVSEWLVENGVDTVFTRKGFDGKGPAYVFSSAEAELKVTDIRTIDEILKIIPTMNAV